MEENIEHKAPRMEMGEQDASAVENKEGQEAIEGETIKNIVAIGEYTENINKTLAELDRNPNLEKVITPEIKEKAKSILNSIDLLKTAIVVGIMAFSLNASASTNTVEGDTMKVKTEQDSIPKAPANKKERTPEQEKRREERQEKLRDAINDAVVNGIKVILTPNRNRNGGTSGEVAP